MIDSDRGKGTCKTPRQKCPCGIEELEGSGWGDDILEVVRENQSSFFLFDIFYPL